MAIKKITTTDLERNVCCAFPALEAADATDGAYFIPTREDGKVFIVAENTDTSNAVDLCVKKGECVSAAAADSVTAVPAGGKMLLCVESGRFMHRDGGIYLRAYATGTTTGSAKLKLGAVQLP